MSRVQCLECGIAVVVDPSGLCPEGHVVGSAGARIENAMGMAAPHPDEPEPWVATVELESTDEPQTAPAVRAVRPVQIIDAAESSDRPGAGPRAQAPDHDALMRELHALGELDGATPVAPSPARTIPPTPTPSQPASPSPTVTAPAGLADAPNVTSGAPAASAHQVTRDEMAEGFAELSALEAAVQAMEFEQAPAQPTTPAGREAPRADADTSPFDELSGLDALFAVGAAEAAAPTAGSPPPAGERSEPAPAAEVNRRPTAASVPDEDATEVPVPITDEAPAEPQHQPARQFEQALDITNFTARGSKVGAGKGGGRRRLFGR